MAPMATSGWPGKPSLRTLKASIGAWSAWAPRTRPAPLELRVIDHAERAVTSRLEQLRGGRLVRQDQQPVRGADFMKNALPAPVARGRHRHTLGRSIPLASGNHAAPKGAKPDEHHPVTTSLLADELTEVHHAVPGHIGEPRVADMCVVRPHDRLRVRA